LTTEIFFSTNKVGILTNKQLQEMLDRFNLGKLLSFQETSKGVGKQTMFVSSTSGEFVLKGNPLYEGQFIEERFYIENLSKLTSLPLSLPYIVDTQSDIFGWTYAIMPRLPGRHYNDLKETLNPEEKMNIVELLVECLSELHHWKVESYGEFDPKSYTIRSFNGSYKTWIYNRIRYWLRDAEKYSVITSRDVNWVEELLLNCEAAFDALDSPTFVMGDFKTDNMLVQKSSEGWRLSGLFDFTNGYFGDGIADLPKIVTMYQDNGDEILAKHFISEYFNRMENKESFKERFRVHMLHQKVLDWGCAKATGNVTWDENLSFSEWAEMSTEFETP